ncbi:MAG: hypothetical protein HN884_03815 [Rhodospirillaceae bacterium]|nr:hypothetical protein [Rhodospirillaceae bacterium]
MKLSDLQSDCENCLGLCCVAPPFAKSAEFAYAKSEGEPCRYLGEDYRCSIHGDLAEQGFTGCVKFECFGAGQKVTHHQFKGLSWREDHLTAKRLFHIFFIVKTLHQKISKIIGNEKCEKKVYELERLSFLSEDELLTIDINQATSTD